ncbi:LemA family protein [Allofustis seminis]|uniref:LemA family protein n=1 Tax=Allofustis seminis TaxID=166939 RepID=UPI00037744B5|nr:LemA family protein [Allofustis seminis]
MEVIGILIIIVAAIALWGVRIYNELVGIRENVFNAKSQIAVQIESRWDALKSIIDATKQYSRHEAETLEKVTAQRTSVSQASSVEAMEKSEEQFAGVLSRLIAVAEAYPELKASELYQNAMRSVEEFENKVRQSRMIYNDSVTKLNRAVQEFPSSVIAGMFNFTKEPYFEETEEKREMPSWE